MTIKWKEAKWKEAMQSSLSQIMKSVHVMKEGLMAKVSRHKNSCGTGPHSENKHA